MRVLITGAARAIGAATATELTNAGHQVIATARDTALLDSLDVALRLPLDVTSESSIIERWRARATSTRSSITRPARQRPARGLSH